MVESNTHALLPCRHLVNFHLYVFKCFFLTQVTEKQSAQDVSGSLKIAVKLGILSASGEGDFEFSDEVKEVTNSLSFKFHGDTIIDPPPQTYQVRRLETTGEL